MTNGISLDIFGYIRGGNVPAPKNKGKQMNDEHKYSWTTDGDCFIDFVVQKTSHVIDTFAWAVGRNYTYPKGYEKAGFLKSSIIKNQNKFFVCFAIDNIFCLIYVL